VYSALRIMWDNEPIPQSTQAKRRGLGVSRPLRTVGSRSSVGRSRASRPMIYAYVQMFAKLPGVWSNDPVTLGVAAYQWYLMSISSRSSSGSVVG